MTPRLLVALLLLPLLHAPPADAAARWQWPLTGTPQVTRAFGLGPTPYSPGHRGADLAGTPGQPVLAAGDGRVSFAGHLAGRGVVTVTHGALRTTYEPVAPSVRVGQAVTRGGVIGTLDEGHAGCPVAACLHWGLRRGETYLDPVRLVGRGPVRLLPPGDPPRERAAPTSSRLGSRSGTAPEPGVLVGARVSASLGGVPP